MLKVKPEDLAHIEMCLHATSLHVYMQPQLRMVFVLRKDILIIL